MDRRDVIELFGYLKATGLRPPTTAESQEGQEAMVNAFLGQYGSLPPAKVQGLKNRLSRLKYWPRFYDVDEALEEMRREAAAAEQAERSKPITMASPPRQRQNAKILAWTIWKLKERREIMRFNPEHSEIVKYGQQLGLSPAGIRANYQLLKIVLNDMNFARVFDIKDIGYRVYINPEREVCFSVTTAKGFNPNKMIQVGYDPVKANPKLANLL